MKDIFWIKWNELFEDEYKKVMEKLDALEEEGNELLSRFESDEKLHEDDIILIRGHNHQLI
jgi:hypothetical protein